MNNLNMEAASKDTAAAAASIIIPTFNGAQRIGACLDALSKQHSCLATNVEIVVVNDGSTDNIAEVTAAFPGVRLISQPNAGPAAARNRGASEAQGNIILFTDDDCVPMSGWLDAMLSPFRDPEVVGAKGIYRTHQRILISRFVQIEYEDRYRIMIAVPNIDFVDTYSAAFVRKRFLEMDGYDQSFPVACAEDIELSYRMSARGWKMKFVPEAIVYHSHPATLAGYVKKKYKFAFWRVLAVRKNPSKAIKDSHTPQIMKLQLLFAPALLLASMIDVVVRSRVPITLFVLLGFLISTLPFVVRSFSKDPLIAVLSPFLLMLRACAQVAGVASGLIYFHSRRAVPARANSHP